uniref:Uncharacterized protein n=1 Tax=Babesia bovis TaxID=5865 RepID=S6B637_BABBO|nr:hypothetical protein [Babesia bovis]
MQFLFIFIVMVSQAFCDDPPVPAGDRDKVSPARSIRNISAATLRDCARIYGSGLRVCSAVHVDDGEKGRAGCNEMLCKSLCCKAASTCQKSSFLSLTTEECIASNLEKQLNGCCVVGKSKGSTMVYAGGVVGAMIIISGLYFIVSMGSVKVIKGEKPVDSDENQVFYETKMPHMEVSQLIATDGDDVFWED